MSQPGRRCGSCQWWERAEEWSDTTRDGYCHAAPPVRNSEEYDWALWPQAREDDWCAHWTPAPKPAQ